MVLVADVLGISVGISMGAGAEDLEAHHAKTITVIMARKKSEFFFIGVYSKE
jgi:hypothetical protein